MLILVAIVVSGCEPAAPEKEAPPAGARATSAALPWFVDVTEELGLDFTHDAGTIGRYFMPEVVGSGAALFDYDGDGRLDIYLIQNGDSPRTTRPARPRPRIGSTIRNPMAISPM